MPTQEEIERVIENTDMVELVSPYTKLTKQGKNFKGLCPFHNEDTPSFVVSQEKHLAHCFGCGKGGNPITFLMDIKQVGFNEALGELAQKNGIKLSGFSQNKKKQDFSKYYEMMQLAAKFYTKNLTTTKSGLEALEYLHKRGLDDETIKTFQIGLSPQSLSTLYQVLKDSNYLELDMMDLGLVKKGDKGYYDLFTRRIMFPIANEQGNVIGFSARIFNNPDKTQPKYINTMDTFLYKKGTVLYHLDQAKTEILRKKRVILHEGQMDVIAAHRAGYTEAVCCMGTALTKEQALTLKKYASSAIICYDGDKAGIAASKKAIQIFKSVGMSVHLVLLPNGMDPDEFILKQGISAYQSYFEHQILDEQQYLFEIAFLNKNLQDIGQVEQIKEEIFSMMTYLNSQTLKETYLTKLAKALNVSLDSITLDYNHYYNANGSTQYVENRYTAEDYIDFVETPYVAEPPKRISPQFKKNFELRLFMYARESKEKAQQIDHRIMNYMSAFTPAYREVWIQLLNNYYYQYESFDDALFCSILTTEQKAVYLSIIEQLKGNPEKYSEADLECCIEKLKELEIKEEIRVLKEKAMKTQDPKMLEQIYELKKSQMKNRRK